MNQYLSLLNKIAIDPPVQRQALVDVLVLDILRLRVINLRVEQKEKKAFARFLMIGGVEVREQLIVRTLDICILQLFCCCIPYTNFAANSSRPRLPRSRHSSHSG